MVTALVGPNTQSGIALIAESDEKTRCSFSYARDCNVHIHVHIYTPSEVMRYTYIIHQNFKIEKFTPT